MAFSSSPPVVVVMVMVAIMVMSDALFKAQAQTQPAACAANLVSCIDYLNATTKPLDTCCNPIKEAVESVNADITGNKLTVTGKVDPKSVKERVEQKTRNKVELISPQPKTAGDKPSEKKSDDKKGGDKPSEKKSDDKKGGDKPSEKKSDEKKSGDKSSEKKSGDKKSGDKPSEKKIWR